MTVTRTALLAETRCSEAELEAVALRLINEGERRLIDSLAGVSDGDGNCFTTEVYFTDSGAALLREHLTPNEE